jgi:predicted XRE-type DNA-binding protein
MIKFTNCQCEVERGKFSINNIPLDCPAVWRLIAGGHTVGVFQLEKKLGQDWAKRVRPENVKELAALVSLLRPGPLECVGENTLITRRREGRGANKCGYSNYRSTIKELYNQYCEVQKHYTKMRGLSENNPGSKLSQNQVGQIKRLLNDGQLTQKEIAQKFGVQQSTISRIKRGKSYDSNKVISNEITKKLNIISVDTQSGKLINNKIEAVLFKGRGSVYSVRVRTSWTFAAQASWLDIRATTNHCFLTLRGWKQLGDIKPGDYVAIFTGKRGGTIRKDNSGAHIQGYKNFRNIAFYNWQYNCACCNWQEASLDVNHLVGNRHTNNNADNLAWLCPNHHRMYTDGKLSEKTIREMREKYRLPQISDTRFVRVEEIKYEGEENLYDIAVEGPHNNYLAGNFVVHNSGMSQDYVDIKFGRKKHSYIHPSLKPILEQTYGCMVYQEQAIKIATDIAGFSPENADQLRSAIGKKKPELMAKLKSKFTQGAQEHGKIARGIAEEIFGWIEKCQRYSFNLSHAISYAMIAYQTAWLKCHFPHEFFTSYLTYSQYKGDPKEEIYKLIQDARLFGVDILPPDIRRGNIHFQMTEKPQKGVAFGLAHIRGVGASAIQKIVSAAPATPGAGSLETWADFCPGFS